MRTFRVTVRSTQIYILTILCLLFIHTSSSFAQEVITTQGKLRIQPVFPEVCLSKYSTFWGSGGFGGGLIIGYGLAPRLDIDLAWGYDRADNNGGDAAPSVTSSFNRSFYLATVTYRLPVLNRLHVKLGAGGGLYIPGNLTLYSYQEKDYTIHYKKAIGAHVMTELEYFIMPDLAFNIGVKYYSVTYREAFSEHNGMTGYYYGSDAERLNGSGTDFMGSLAFYF